MDIKKYRKQLNYEIDNVLAKGIVSLLFFLGLLALFVILVSAFLATQMGAQIESSTPLGFGEAFWQSTLRILDPGVLSTDKGWQLRFSMFFAAFGGVLIFSALIAVFVVGIEHKLKELHKGHSPVMENGHTIILGWSEQVFTIISELVTANENQKRSCIVILGPHEKQKMEEEIQYKVGSTGRMRIICRTGDPAEVESLALVSLNTAKSIIVLSPDGDSDTSDINSIQTVLAILNFPYRCKDPYHIVAELHNSKNMEIAKVIGKDEVEWIFAGDMLARIIAQVSCQPHLSIIYTELLNFTGDEIYFTRQKELVGKTYGEALAHYENNAVIGICYSDGSATINPPMDTMIKSKDYLAVIAEDDDKIVYNPNKISSQTPPLLNAQCSSQKKAHILILGWNWRGISILQNLDNYVLPQSEVLIIARHPEIEEQIRECSQKLVNLTVNIKKADITDKTTLEQIDLALFNQIIQLGYYDTLGIPQADACTLITLLNLHHIVDDQAIKPTIVSEMRDIRSQNIAEVAGIANFVVSPKLISLILSHVSENKGLNGIFTDMFNAEGSEIYIKPASHYVIMGQSMTFYEILLAARSRGETAIGYTLDRLKNDPDRAYGVKINPPKSKKITWEANDNIIVVSGS